MRGEPPRARALVDAVEALGGATSAEVLELVTRSPAPARIHVPVTADDVAALSGCGRCVQGGGCGRVRLTPARRGGADATRTLRR